MVHMTIFDFRVEEVMLFGHWESAVVADYVQHTHPVLRQLRERLGSLKLRPTEPFTLEFQVNRFRGGSKKKRN